jgi:hypothetical protein
MIFLQVAISGMMIESVGCGNDYGQWGEWFQEVNFNVELTNADCP